MSNPLNQSLRVIHLDDATTWRGGQHQVFLLINELQQLGVTQALASPGDSPLAQRVRALGIEIFPLSARFGELDLFAPRRLARFAREWNASLLHAHTGHAHTLGLRAARRLSPPRPLVVTRRVDFAVGGNAFSRRKYTAPGQHFIAISSAVHDVLTTGGVAPERITIVPSGVPELAIGNSAHRARSREQLGLAPDELALVNVGALTDHKGHHFLIDAAPAILAAFPRARFHIFGEGELHSALVRQIVGLGLLDKIVLHGYKPGVRAWMPNFDLYISSSHLEGLGTAILDAMLARLPVVAAAGGGVVDIVRPGETGWLAPPRDPTALSAQVIAALGTPAHERTDILDRAEQMVISHFSPAATAAGTLAVYRAALGDAAPLS